MTLRPEGEIDSGLLDPNLGGLGRCGGRSIWISCRHGDCDGMRAD